LNFPDPYQTLTWRFVLKQAYAQEIDEHKKTMLLVNKADLLPSYVR